MWEINEGDIKSFYALKSVPLRDPGGIYHLDTIHYNFFSWQHYSLKVLAIIFNDKHVFTYDFFYITLQVP